MVASTAVRSPTSVVTAGRARAGDSLTAPDSDGLDVGTGRAPASGRADARARKIGGRQWTLPGAGAFMHGPIDQPARWLRENHAPARPGSAATNARENQMIPVASRSPNVGMGSHAISRSGFVASRY